MRTAHLDYHLPPELVAQRPTAERDGARMLVVEGEALEDAAVSELARKVPEGALLVVNDTRVVPARLLGTRPRTGGRVEVLLHRRLDSTPDGRSVRYEVLGRASKRLRPGDTIDVGSALGVEVLTASTAGSPLLEVRLDARDDRTVDAIVESVGHVPLPPYIEREDDETDRARYQTVFAKSRGAAAAPTAGLHLTEAMLAELRARGVEVASITLHVGLGTFQPVMVDDLDQHLMHAEEIEVTAEVAASIERARARGGPVVAIGTTVVRALESARDPDRAGFVRPMRGATRLLIQPGHAFGVVDALLTNFHLPKSTLLALVFAFGGEHTIRRAYAHAVAERYRFFSYGDAMWIPRRAPSNPSEDPARP